jgi:hypothetical protein
MTHVPLRNISLVLVLLTLGIACNRVLPAVVEPTQTVTPADVVLDSKTGLIRVENLGSLPHLVGPLVDAVGMTSGGCTATHVGDRHVLTAGHCLETQEGCKDTSVRWGYLSGRAPSMVSHCTRLIRAERKLGLDYSLFEVDRAPDAVIVVGPAPAAGPKGYPITMLGHPSGAPLHWSGMCRLVNPKELPGGLNHAQANHMIFHHCASARGSSGSPLIDPLTGRMIGIHTGNLYPWSIATPLPLTAVGG